jgi:Ni,Fe-hydrogenase I large subunit
MGFKMMWQNVLREQNPFRQNVMIKDILLLKPYLSAYYEATKLIIDKQQSDYQEFQDKHQDKQQSKQEKIIESQQQQNEDSRNLDHKEYNNNNAKF